MQILITGGAGFIGAHLIRALITRGHFVVSVDNFSDFLYSTAFKTDRLNALVPDFPRQQNITGDITDSSLLAKVFALHTFDLVIHLAALANPGRSITAADEYQRVNVTGTQVLLTAMAASNVPRLIFAGSSSVYNDEVVPFTEDGPPLRPRSPYGQTKAQAEALIAEWQKAQPGRQATILRFFSVYGPWGRPDMAPMIFAQRILSGETISVTQEERKRDFTYIDDIVSGIASAVTTPFPFEIINLGRGEPTTLQEFIAALERAAGKKAVTQPRETPDGEMRITYADITKAHELLGYQPQVSVDQGTAALVDWLKEYQKINKPDR